MSLTNIAEHLPENLAKAIANPLFPMVDSGLRSGRHICRDDLDHHSFLMDFFSELVSFYQGYHCELVQAPEGFFYLRPRANTLISRSVLSELDMLVGKVLCFLYLSPERLAQEGLFTTKDVCDEFFSLIQEAQWLKYVTQRAKGSDMDREKLVEKIHTSLRRLQRLGMLLPLPSSDKFRISEAIFRFGSDVRLGEEPQQAQERLIRDGEAIIPDA